MPAAAHGNGDFCVAIGLPGVSSNHQTKARSCLIRVIKLSVGTWAALVSPTRNRGEGGREQKGSFLRRKLEKSSGSVALA